MFQVSAHPIAVSYATVGCIARAAGQSRTTGPQGPAALSEGTQLLTSRITNGLVVKLSQWDFFFDVPNGLSTFNVRV
jgi:hypothetical protein